MNIMADTPSTNAQKNQNRRDSVVEQVSSVSGTGLAKTRLDESYQSCNPGLKEGDNLIEGGSVNGHTIAVHKKRIDGVEKRPKRALRRRKKVPPAVQDSSDEYSFTDNDSKQKSRGNSNQWLSTGTKQLNKAQYGSKSFSLTNRLNKLFGNDRGHHAKTPERASLQGQFFKFKQGVNKNGANFADVVPHYTAANHVTKKSKNSSSRTGKSEKNKRYYSRSRKTAGYKPARTNRTKEDDETSESTSSSTTGSNEVIKTENRYYKKGKKTILKRLKLQNNGVMSKKYMKPRNLQTFGKTGIKYAKFRKNGKDIQNKKGNIVKGSLKGTLASKLSRQVDHSNEGEEKNYVDTYRDLRRRRRAKGSSRSRKSKSKRRNKKNSRKKSPKRPSKRSRSTK